MGMSKDKIREVMAIYRSKFEEWNIPKEKFPEDEKFLHSVLPLPENRAFAHCHAMLDEMEIFLQERRIEKVFRWLGWIQGCLWRSGVYTLEELKNHNRP